MVLGMRQILTQIVINNYLSKASNQFKFGGSNKVLDGGYYMPAHQGWMFSSKSRDKFLKKKNY